LDIGSNREVDGTSRCKLIGYPVENDLMERTYNNFVVAVITATVMPGLCLEQAGAPVCVSAFQRIDQNTRNGP
jgi:hypothetical protein